MPANYVLLEKVVVGAAGATSVLFSGIPQTGYTDLVLKVCGRTNRNYGEDQFYVRFNLDTGNNYASRYIQGYDGATSSGSQSGTNTAPIGMISAAGSTANSFGNAELYIPNYTSSTYKSVSTDSVSSGNASPIGMRLDSFLWSNTAAINSIYLDAANGTEWLVNSTFYLYGVAKLGTTPAIVPYATGGDTIMTDGTYWYHTFVSSGTFTPAKALTADYLVVAGGGGSGVYGGGGAGGLRSTVTATGGGGSLESALSLASGTGYTVTIGAGGAGTVTDGAKGSSGSNSVFSTITSTGGGGGASGSGVSTGVTGGSGGGGGVPGSSANQAGGSGTANQGYAGGFGDRLAGGGGGGAGAVGGNMSGQTGGLGGNGVTTSISGTSTTYAGGGGGLSWSGSTRSGGTGGGGTGGILNTSQGTAGTANTGGGGGGNWELANSYPPRAGGSGIVIVRYAV
jgi:hypothetical protein